ncbi:hypothetical protein J4Q44_G00107520 [Coregonus suidteri]|uniref:Secreted protein n=1 Tax=Coregonus suidteri TaxID=861788 RepID=A0AAN8M7R9_9TELE
MSVLGCCVVVSLGAVVLVLEVVLRELENAGSGTWSELLDEGGVEVALIMFPELYWINSGRAKRRVDFPHIVLIETRAPWRA